jgi:phospholipid-transporting ATPase
LTALKELVEDARRHRADARVNASPAEVFCPGKGGFATRPWRDVAVGDVVRVRDEKPFPADLVLLASRQAP